MRGGPSMWACQVCGHEEGWPDGRLSGDVLCRGCATWAMIPRLMLAVERSDGEVMAEILRVVDDVHDLPDGWHDSCVTLGGRVH